VGAGCIGKCCLLDFWPKNSILKEGTEGYFGMRKCLQFALVCLVATAGELRSDEALPNPEPVNPATVRQSIKQDFDGRVFVANYGQDEKLATGRDVIRFESGLMSTANCIKFGFMPAPYLLRVEGNRTYFYSEMPSEKQGKMKFTGYIENDKFNANASWQQVRWYWNVDVTLMFDGKRANPGDDLTATFKQ
jgi:hypothetical protein